MKNDHPAHAELQRLRTYGSGWNGPRSLGADKASFDNAESFLDALTVKGLKDVTIWPTIFSVGTAALEIEGPDVKALFEFEGNGMVSANLDVPGTSIDFEFLLDVLRLPESVLKALTNPSSTP